MLLERDSKFLLKDMVEVTAVIVVDAYNDAAATFLHWYLKAFPKKETNLFDSFNLKFNPFDNTPSLKVSNISVLSE